MDDDETSLSHYTTVDTETAPYLPPAWLAKRLNWDVFLSFRGEDTRKKIMLHLKDALELNGVRVFTDNEGMRRGDEIPKSLGEAIVDSALAVAIISPRYADSHWCLDELCRIFDCRKRVIPIFHRVDPSHVRGQKGKFGEAYKEMVKERNSSELQQQTWKNALTDVGNLSGYTCASESDDTEVIQRIVKQIVGELKNSPEYVAKVTVGLDSRVDKVLEKLDHRLTGVRFLNIHGTPGIGKTTLAKAVFNKMAGYFKNRCFISNVREKLATDGGCLSVMNLLIHDLSTVTVPSVKEESAGKKSIKKIFNQSKVLVVLDDVSDGNQLETLGIVRECFGEEGSRIIVTSRNIQVFLPPFNDELHEVDKLSTSESLELFCIHAMGRREPTQEFLKLSKEIVSLTDGLPLALEVFGSSLVKKTVREWEDSLKKLRKIKPDKLQGVLEISYDALDPVDKTAFLDISCLLLQMDLTREDVVDILEGCDIRAELAIGNLVSRSLMKISVKNQLWMHDQIRDMGKQIVARESTDDPGHRSRLWDSGDIRRVLRDEKGTGAIRGFILNLTRPSDQLTTEMVNWYNMRKHPSVSTTSYYLAEKFKSLTREKADQNENSVLYTKSFEKMTNLKLLQINYSELHGDIKYMPSELRCLQWRGCPQKALPANLPEELRVLDVSGSNIQQLWSSNWFSRGPNKVASNLVVLNLSRNPSLTALPDLSGHRHLQKLNLELCVGLTKIHKSIGRMSSLVHFNLKQCSNLVDFPSDVTGMKGLKELILSSCCKFRGLPHDVRSMKSLTLLCLDGTAIEKLPEYLPYLTRLEVLNLDRCSFLKELPEWIGELNSLKELSLCSTNLKEIPDSIKSLSSLEKLRLLHCYSFVALPDSVQDLKSLAELHLNGTLIQQLPTSICSLPYLRILSVSGCRSLSSLPGSIQGLASITELELDDTPITELPDQICSLKSIRKLRMSNCTSLVKLPQALGRMSTLTTLWVVGANIEILPESIGELENLTWLNLNKCRKLSRLPYSIRKLRSLHVFTMEDTAVACLPECFGMLNCLRVLKMNKKPLPLQPEVVHELSVFPASFCGLFQLEELDARACNISGQIHESFAMLSKLEILDLGYNSFHSLPSTLESLCFLEKLSLRRCEKLKSLPRLPSTLVELVCADCYELESISDLSNLHRLQELQLANCSRLTDVPGLECLKSLRRLYMGCCNASASAVRGRLSKVTLRNLNNLSVPGSGIPDWFSQEPINFATHPNRAIKNVIVVVVVSVDLQQVNAIQAELPTIVGIQAQILRQDNHIFSTTLILTGVPRTTEYQLYLCRFKDYHPLVSLLREGDIIQTVQMSGANKGVELKTWGVFLVFENDDDHKGDESLLPLAQQSVTQKLVQFFQSY